MSEPSTVSTVFSRKKCRFLKRPVFEVKESVAGPRCFGLNKNQSEFLGWYLGNGGRKNSKMDIKSLGGFSHIGFWHKFFLCKASRIGEPRLAEAHELQSFLEAAVFVAPLKTNE